MTKETNPHERHADEKSKESVSRRDFMIKAATMTGGLILGAGCATPHEAGSVASQGATTAPGAVAPIPFSAEKPLRVALIGTGGRMNGALLPVFLKDPTVEILACVDSNPKHLNSTLDRIERERGKRPQGYTKDTDFKEVLHRDDVQAAFSACPCDLHATIYIEAMTAGKPIYGEKPAAITLAETKMLKEAWLKSKSIVQIGFQRRVSNRYIDGIKMLRDGEIGEMWEGHAAWNNNSNVQHPLGSDPDKIWLSQRARSGDWMLEQACHTWDVLGWVAGDLPKRACGAGRRDVFKSVQPERDVTDYYIATLEYPNGLLVNYNHTWFAPNRDNGTISGVYERIAGLKGAIDLGNGRISYTDGSKEPKLLHPGEPEMSSGSVKHFLECVREGRQPNSSIGNGINASLTGLLVRKAVDERRPVTMDEILHG